MKIKFYPSAFLFVLCYSFSLVSAQGTFTQIHQILQTKCSGGGCHQSGGNPSFDVTVSESALHAELVNGTPLNPAAVAKGDKLISPGYVDRSLLLRKIAHGLNENNPHISLNAGEGVNMPDGLPALSKPEIELIRQWILFGAPLSGNVVDTAVINMYYSGKGKDDIYTNHPAPPTGDGFQIYVGKLLIPANTEPYYYIKHDLKLLDGIEIPKIATMLAASSHHFVIFKFQPGGQNNYANGLRIGEENSSHADVTDGIGTGPGLWQYDLPANSAYIWPKTTVLDFNLHIRNPMADTVMATEIYINVYTQPAHTAQKEMEIRNFPVFHIVIPPDSQQHEFVEIARDTNRTHYWNVWQLYGHTHKYGTDYDIFTRNPDGSMGEQQYESWYEYELGKDPQGNWQGPGYHRYGVDATFRFYPDDSLLQVDPRIGWIHRARYVNNTNDTIFWGDSSEEEMMVMGFQFVQGDPLPALSVDELSQATIQLRVFPNPASDAITLNYSLYHNSDIQVELTNVLGETVSLLDQKDKPVGNYLDEIELNNQYAAGVYLLTLKTEYASVTKRIVIE